MDPFGFVVLTAVGTFVFTTYLAVKVARARERYSIPVRGVLYNTDYTV